MVLPFLLLPGNVRPYVRESKKGTSILFFFLLPTVDLCALFLSPPLISEILHDIPASFFPSQSSKNEGTLRPSFFFLLPPGRQESRHQSLSLFSPRLQSRHKDSFLPPILAMPPGSQPLLFFFSFSRYSGERVRLSELFERDNPLLAVFFFPDLNKLRKLRNRPFLFLPCTAE